MAKSAARPPPNHSSVRSWPRAGPEGHRPGLASAGRFAVWQFWLKGGRDGQSAGRELQTTVSGRFKLNAPSRVL
jgi:hypothetical protein